MYIDPSFSYTNFSLEEQSKILAAGRSNNELDSSKLVETCRGFGIEIPPIKESIVNVFKRMQVNLKKYSCLLEETNLTKILKNTFFILQSDFNSSNLLHHNCQTSYTFQPLPTTHLFSFDHFHSESLAVNHTVVLLSIMIIKKLLQLFQ